MNGVRLFCILLVLSATVLRGDHALDLARIHVEAIGGVARLREWTGMHATGRVVVSGERELAFELIAARPNRVRVVIRAEGRALLQATDGVHPPWQLEMGTTAAPRVMAVTDAREFLADAEFDDPLASGPERGYSFDYAGETEWQGRQLLKVLVTRRGEDPGFLLLDPDTYFIVLRLSKQRASSGREITLETRYGDFRPVAGIIFPHRVEVYSDGQLLRETTLTLILRIPEPLPETFEMPKGEGAP